MSGLKLLIELLSLRMGLSDGHEHRPRIGRLSPGFGFGIMAILHLRITTARFFQQLDDLRCLLLAENRKLQGELLTPLGKLILAPPRCQNQHHYVKRRQRNSAFQAGKGWRVWGTIAEGPRQQV
jgi:hypothetical protein